MKRTATDNSTRMPLETVDGVPVGVGVVSAVGVGDGDGDESGEAVGSGVGG